MHRFSFRYSWHPQQQKPELWLISCRAAFESNLCAHHTTLTAGEVLSVTHGAETYKFLVDLLWPADAMQIVDTDLKVEIVRLDRSMVEVAGYAPKWQRDWLEADIMLDRIVAETVAKGTYMY